MKSVALGFWAILASMPALSALSGMEKGYVDRLVSGDWISIRSAAQSLLGSSNTEVLDVAAEVLLEKYPYAGKSPDAVDAMAWICRALGESNISRYRPVLEQVALDESVHRKLREHCDSGAGSLPRKTENAFVAGTVNLAALRGESAAATPAIRRLANLPGFASLTGTERDFVDQLVNGDWASIRNAAQGLFSKPKTEVLDVVAEVLLEKYPYAGKSPDAVDAMAWVCKSLGNSNLSRYRQVLEQVANDMSVHRKLRHNCEKGANSLPGKIQNAYVPGTVNLAALRGESGATPAR